LITFNDASTKDMNKIEIDRLKGTYKSVLNKISKDIISGKLVSLSVLKEVLENKNYDLWLYTTIEEFEYLYNESAYGYPIIKVVFIYKNDLKFEGGFTVTKPWKGSINSEPIASGLYLETIEKVDEDYL